MCTGMCAMLHSQVARDRFTREPFPQALRGLMDERRLSYRQLAYKTKLSAGYLNHLTKGTRPVPSDEVIAVIAEALCVTPEYFLEYRLRQVARAVAADPELADTLHGVLVRHTPLDDDVVRVLRRTGNGGGQAQPVGMAGRASLTTLVATAGRGGARPS